MSGVCMNIKKNDQVLVIKGKDRGKSGKVVKVFPSENRLVIANINTYKKHLKKSQKNPYGGITDISMPINRANVALICPRCEKNTKPTKTVNNKNKLRICKKCQESVEPTK